jgi:hypothetical protein
MGKPQTGPGPLPRMLNQLGLDRIAQHIAEDREEMAVLLNRKTFEPSLPHMPMTAHRVENTGRLVGEAGTMRHSGFAPRFGTEARRRNGTRGPGSVAHRIGRSNPVDWVSTTNRGKRKGTDYFSGIGFSPAHLPNRTPMRPCPSHFQTARMRHDYR